MKKVQLIVYILALMVSVVYLVFTLGFSTNYAIGQGFLGQFYTDVQEANKQMFDLGLWIVILVGLSFLFNTHKNSKFFLSNYILSLAIAGLMFFTGLTTLNHMGPLKESYLLIDESMLFVLTVINAGEITTKNFEQGVTLSYVLFAQAVIVFLMTGYKVKMHISRAKAKAKRSQEVSL